MIDKNNRYMNNHLRNGLKNNTNKFAFQTISLK